MPYRPTERSEKHREERRARIVAAAQQLFATQGYETTTMQQVVREAGTSIGNCYFYFRNKEDLLKAVIEEANTEIGREIDAAIAQVPIGPARLVAAIDAGVRALLSRAAVMRLMLAQATNPALRETVSSIYVARVQHFFEAAPELLQGLDRDLVAYAWEGALFNLMRAALAGTVPVNAEALSAFLIHWNMRALGFSEETIEQAWAVIRS
ncbi:putative HTH-type transcriptional regulator YfiR [Thermoflexales bacterium]|nr:putative HTH-type transcriptional regulator YfiR [Thermoflexales bacterium]